MNAGLIGHPATHSVSSAIQMAAFDFHRIGATYRLWDIDPTALAFAIDCLHLPSYCGVQVATPHKVAVLEHVDVVDETARVVGACSCIAKNNGKLTAYNFDSLGFQAALDEAAFDPAGASACVLGAGDAARSIVHALLVRGAGSITVVNRTKGRAVQFLHDLRERVGGHLPVDRVVLGRGSSANRANLIVNTTMVGMDGGGAESDMFLSADDIAPNAFVFDLVYRPRMTPLLLAAEAKGATIMDGLPMLVHLNAACFDMWCEWPAPVRIMRAAAEAALQQTP